MISRNKVAEERYLLPYCCFTNGNTDVTIAVGESELTEQELQLAVQLETLRYVKKCYRIGCVLLIPVVTAVLLGIVAAYL